MPEAFQSHVDAALTNASVAYSNASFAADAIAPMVPVRKQSDKYFVLDEAREPGHPRVAERRGSEQEERRHERSTSDGWPGRSG
jgi:hypothetical protein